MKKLFFLITFLMLPLWALAQVVVPSVAPAVPVPPVVVDPTQDFIALLLQSLGGIKGMSALGVVAIIVQLLLKAFNIPAIANIFGSTFKDADGHIKLLVVSFLSLVGGVTALMLPPTSLGLGAALIHSATLTAVTVFLNQIYQQFIQKKTP